MLIGLLAGLMTGALWGLAFIAPRVVEPFSALDISVVRYLIFGVVSAALMILPQFRPTGMSRRMLLIGLMLGAVGTFGYFLAISYAVLLANWRERSMPWGRLALPLGLIAAGLAVVNAASLREAPSGEVGNLLLGVALSVFALGMWIAYGLVNAVVMRAPDPPDALRWTGVQGIGCGALALLLLPFISSGPAMLDLASPATQHFFLWALMMGVVTSWLGTYGWVVASERLPMALSAQLIVAETVFGLGYGLAFEQRLPTASEAMGGLLQLVGVVVAVAIFARRRIITPEPGTP